MKTEYIAPFVDSVKDFFSTMLGCACTEYEAQDEAEVKEIASIIGLGGPARGIVALLFTKRAALNISSRLLGTEVTVVDETVSDVVAEVANIVAGSAKSKLSAATGSTIELSLPTVFRGTGYTIHYPSQATWAEIPFT
ncbi:MAG: chemotaxis protein CheX, partial [FCB group bacterium]|nr:chemotaxis protein CheX [FCB group bacterium]